VRVNFIDILLILLFFGMLALGFFQGMIRLIVLILAFYLSLVLASLYYPAVGEFFVRRLDAQRFVGQYVGFALVLFFSFIALAAAGIYTFRYAQLPGQLQYLDRIIGTLLGMVLGAFVVGILAAVLWNLMIVRGGRTIDFPFMRSLGSAVATSQVLSYFANYLLPNVYALLDPVLPDGAALIFAVQ
jgi:membrane protein required for colicin V production